MQIFEINTWAWLTDLGRRLGRRVSLGEVPDSIWGETLPPGTDAVWLMGVWERSPFARDYARTREPFVSSQRAALPDVGDEDVIGSAYSVRRYVVDERLGGTAGLAAARARLSARGARLLLDYVPNHVAPDHPWAREHPERFVRGTAEDLARDPASYVRVGDTVLACGRDPNFPAWPEVVQLNAFAEETRRATIDTLASIAELCDGVRCDMAMLPMTDVFARTWGDRAGPRPERELWPEVIGAVRRRSPAFGFLAEAYWDLEWSLQQQGFDWTYDKRLYDRLVQGDAASVRAHLGADLAYQQRMARFVENHDEPRAATALGPRLLPALVAIATLPGVPFLHEGQREGRRVHVPVTLRRRPEEPIDRGAAELHDRLLGHVATTRMREGGWSLCEVEGWADNSSCASLVAWCWTTPRGRHVIAVNLSDTIADGRVRLPWSDLRGRTLTFEDSLRGERYARSGDELEERGLYVRLPPRGAHVLSTPS